jgi:hypothetical protein
MKADHKIYRIGPQATLALSKISTRTIQQESIKHQQIFDFFEIDLNNWRLVHKKTYHSHHLLQILFKIFVK